MRKRRLERRVVAAVALLAADVVVGVRRSIPVQQMVLCRRIGSSKVAVRAAARLLGGCRGLDSKEQDDGRHQDVEQPNETIHLHLSATVPHNPIPSGLSEQYGWPRIACDGMSADGASPL